MIFSGKNAVGVFSLVRFFCTSKRNEHPSIPPNIALRLTTLIPLQILQDAGSGANGEVIVLIYSKGRDAGSHGEAVKISREVESSLYHLLVLKVVTRIE